MTLVGVESLCRVAFDFAARLAVAVAVATNSACKFQLERTQDSKSSLALFKINTTLYD